MQQVHPHASKQEPRGQLELKSFDKKEDDQVFSVSFEHDKLIMKSKNEDNLSFLYRRIYNFPE